MRARDVKVGVRAYTYHFGARTEVEVAVVDDGVAAVRFLCPKDCIRCLAYRRIGEDAMEERLFRALWGTVAQVRLPLR